jgi:hypothetical protein
VSVSANQCDSVQKVIDKNPKASAKLQALRQQMQAPNADRPSLFQQVRAVYDSLHLDPGVARACAQLRRSSAGGTQLAAGGGYDESGAAPGSTRPHPGLVFVQTANGSFVPRVLTLGVGNYDVTQVLGGLNEGEKVALINAAMLAQARSDRQQQIQSRVGLPGVSQQGNQNAAQQGGARQGGGQGQGGQGRPQGAQGGQATQAPPPPPAPPSGSRPPGE